MSNSPMDTLKNLLGDNADEKIKTALSVLSDSENGISTDNDIPEVPSTDTPFDTQALDSVMQIKNIINNLSNSENDTRANLLLSLKPYMRSSRRNSIDTAVRMLNLTKLSGLLKLR